MSISGITFSGIASGLDTAAIINALVAVEELPIKALESKKRSLQGQKNLFGNFEDLLNKLKEAAEGIKESDNFLKRAAATDKEDFFTASASDTALPGTYDVEVMSLAKGQVAASLGRVDRDTTIVGSGDIAITMDPDGAADPSFVVTVAAGTGTLNDIASAINTSPDNGPNGVQASVLDTGQDGANRYKLVLTSKETGDTADFSLGIGATDPGLIDLVNELNAGTASTASDAVLKLNGIQIQRDSNTISDAIDGVTMNLKAKGEGLGDQDDLTKLTISTDSTATAEQIEGFVEAYNAVVGFVTNQSTVGENGQAQGALFGDITLRNVRSTLRNIMGSQVDTGDDAFALLSLVGFKSEVDGTLTFNKGEFEESLSENADAVRNLFSKPGSGIADRLFETIDTYTDIVDGIFKSRKDSFDRQIKRADIQIDEKEIRLEKFEVRQRQRFAALEELMGKLQSQGSAFSAIQAQLF